MKAALNLQPLGAAVSANSSGFSSYSSGVVRSSACSGRLDHAELVVGYGTENGIDYWLVKNSWGSSWGEQGYIKLEMDSEFGACGI